MIRLKFPSKPDTGCDIRRDQTARHALLRATLWSHRHLPDFSGKRRLLGSMLSLCGTQTVPVGRFEMELDLSDRYEQLAALGMYQADTLAEINRYLSAGDCFCDCGAHIGIVSISVANHLGAGGQVYAFEPSPATYARLQRNVAWSDPSLCPVAALPYALGSRSGEEVEFYVSSQHGWSTMSREAARIGEKMGARVVEVTRVKVIALDDFFAGDTPRRPPQVLKIDVEGAELEVLRGAKRLLSVAPPRCIVVEHNEEVLNAVNCEFAGLRGLLEDAGYALSKDLSMDAVFTHRAPPGS